MSKHKTLEVLRTEWDTYSLFIERSKLSNTEIIKFRTVKCLEMVLGQETNKTVGD